MLAAALHLSRVQKRSFQWASKVMHMVVTATLVVVISALLLMILSHREAAPVRQKLSHSHYRELRIARNQLTAGLIDADQYERIVDALRR